MRFRVGPGNSGYNFQPEFMDFDCTITLANGATCAKGQVVCRDLTQIAGTAGADMVVLPTSANAGKPYGVHQGPSFTNNTGATATYVLNTVRRKGYGLVLGSGAGGAVLVGSALIENSSQLGAILGTAAINANVGQALATGSNTTVGASLIANGGGNTAVINADIDCF